MNQITTELNYYEFDIIANTDVSDILLALLGDAGCESFMEKPQGLLAYLPVSQGSQAYNHVLQILSDLQSQSVLDGFVSTIIERQNWNIEWEKNFNPVEIDDICYIHAHFHEPNPKFEHQILITPKMSFGTGHHATTALMIIVSAALDMKNASVLDAGTGTGILAIWAAMRGANHVVGFDNDSWSILNAQENAALNNFEKILFFEGQIHDLPNGQTFDLILANINRNVLLEQISDYAAVLEPDGYMVLSGFYPDDIAAITNACTDAGLACLGTYTRNGWAAIKAQKQ